MKLRLILIIIGLLFLSADVVAFIKRRITPVVALIWMLFSAAVLLFAILPFWKRWLFMVNPEVPLPLVVLILLVLLGLFWTSIGVSKLIDRNRELAMQVALLNQENERIIEILREMGKEL